MVVPVHFFYSASIISQFGERFRDGHNSLVSLLFAVLILIVQWLERRSLIGELSLIYA